MSKLDSANMQKTLFRTLYRPVGLKELQLILLEDQKRFPPRLDWQPIFYPVLNKDYAVQIARDWNTKDVASGYTGFVTEFDVDADYLAQFDEHIVGSKDHRELWVPAEELESFNTHILGYIRVIAAFYGDKYETDADFQAKLQDVLHSSQNPLTRQ